MHMYMYHIKHTKYNLDYKSLQLMSLTPLTLGMRTVHSRTAELLGNKKNCYSFKCKFNSQMIT